MLHFSSICSPLSWSKSKKALAYGVASISCAILAVCSCTVLPLFAGIYKRGAGIGPATAFLYSGPAINILAIVLTAKVLGAEIGIARAIGSVSFSIIIGLLMHLVFRKEEIAKADAMAEMPIPEVRRPLWKTAAFFATMVAILVFASWGKPATEIGVWKAIYSAKWLITSLVAIGFAAILFAWFQVPKRVLIIGAVVTALIAVVFHKEPMVGFVSGIIVLTLTIKIRR